MRIGIVNDVSMTLEGLRRIVSDMPEHQVAWLARNGLEAVLKCNNDKPDLILMDLIMPGINGVEATRRIMGQCPCAILVVTASVKTNQRLAFEALAAGAMDVVRTPSVNRGADADRDDSLQKKINNLSRIIGTQSLPEKDNGLAYRISPNGSDADKNKLLIAIGASTGGPAAVVDVLKKLPLGFPAAVVVVVHVDEEFASGMAEWMSRMVKMPVRLVREGEFPKVGEVLLAATNEHMILSHQQTLHYTPEPVSYPYRPSVDVFLSSLVLHWRGEAIGILLTGMGRDGAKGLKMMREHGWHTIAQDEKSSTIYGMPREAAKIGAASKILSVECIGSELIRLSQEFEKNG